MKTMKRLTNILLSVLMMVFAFTGCGFDEDPLQNRLNDIKNRMRLFSPGSMRPTNRSRPSGC